MVRQRADIRATELGAVARQGIGAARLLARSHPCWRSSDHDATPHAVHRDEGRWRMDEIGGFSGRLSVVTIDESEIARSAQIRPPTHH
jgi:hypothetical protein